jgi:hypothetical protein
VAVARKPRVKKQKLDDTPIDKSEAGGLSWIPSDPSSFIETNKELPIYVSPPTSFSPTATPSPPQTPQLVPPATNAPVIIIPSSAEISPLRGEDLLPALTPTYVPALPQFTPPQPTLSSPTLSENIMSPVNMLSLLLDDKSSGFTEEWPDMSQPGMTEFVNECIDSCFKKPAVAPPPLPQPKNSTSLFPAPIGIFDKTRFMLLDTNAAMASLLGYNSVAELAVAVNSLDDLVDPSASHMAKNATQFFLPNMPFDRMAILRTPNGNTKTVEFRVDLTEQLLIFTVKSVFDDCFGVVPEVPIAPTAKCNSMEYRPSEFLAPID